MATLDLDKRRAEADKKPHTTILDGEEWTLPNPLPAVVVEDLQAGKVRKVIGALFGEDAVPRLSKILSIGDLEDIARDLYGILEDPS